MYVDSALVTARRPAHAPRTRTICRKPTTAVAPATTPAADAGVARRRPVSAAADAAVAHRRPASAAARRTRLADAIVSQWLLEQVPADHRHAHTA